MCGSVCLVERLDVNVKKTHLLLVGFFCFFWRMGGSDHSCLKKVHFKDCCLLTPPQETVIIGVAYDCKEKEVYWTDITSPSISKASINGGEPTAVIITSNVTFFYPSHFWIRRLFSWGKETLKCVLLTDLVSPEGIAIDHFGRKMFWTDSGTDRIEVASLDGSLRRVIINSDLVNPRPIITDSVGCVSCLTQNLYPSVSLTYTKLAANL